MTDTPPLLQDKFYKLMMQKSPEERVIMGCSMFEDDREIVKASLVNINPAITPRQIRKEIFLRFYGLDLTESHLKKIMAAL